MKNAKNPAAHEDGTSKESTEEALRRLGQELGGTLGQSQGFPHHELVLRTRNSRRVRSTQLTRLRGLAGPSRAIALHPAVRQLADAQPTADFGVGVLETTPAPTPLRPPATEHPHTPQNGDEGLAADLERAERRGRRSDWIELDGDFAAQQPARKKTAARQPAAKKPIAKP